MYELSQFDCENINAYTTIACNISLLTTTQSTIATDLDAFAEVSWFTSAYLVFDPPIPARCFKTLNH